MLSRVADSIYWLGRYIERAENVARFIDVNVNLMIDLPPRTGEQWMPLVNTTGDAEAFAARYASDTRENVVQFLTFDRQNPNSIIACLAAARENARTIREVISSEMWEQINTFHLMVQQATNQGAEFEAAPEFYADIRNACHTFAGTTNATMSHGEAWNFCRLGRMLERADKTTRLLDMKYFILLPTVADVGTAYDDIQWAAVLRSASGFEMYRKRYGRIDPHRIIEFLMTDRSFPRAVHYCLIEADRSLHAISGTPRGDFANPAEQRLGLLRAEFDFRRAEDVIQQGLHEHLDAIQVRLNDIGDAVFDTFFAFRTVAGAVVNLTAQQESPQP